MKMLPASFRRRFLKEIEGLFVPVLLLAREMKLLKLRHIALDGTKFKANASKYKALSWGMRTVLRGSCARRCGTRNRSRRHRRSR